MITQVWPPESRKASIAVLMIAVAVAYIERTAISHALPFILDETRITKTESGWILAAFGFGYVASLPFSGKIIRTLGHGRTLRWLSVGWFAAAIAFSLANTFQSMILARLALGLFEGPLFPLFVSWISLAARPESRPTAIGLVEACSYVGMALAGSLTVLFAQSVGWRGAYVAVGAIALAAWIASYRLQEPPHREQVQNTLNVSREGEETVRLLRSAALIAIGFFLYNIAKSFYSTWFPTVLVKGFFHTAGEAAKITFIQSLTAPVASLLVAAGSVSLLRNGYSFHISRCLPLSLGLIVGSTLAIAVLLPQAIAVISILSFVGLISTSALIWNAVPDNVDPILVGTVAGWVNAFANIGSIVSPIAIAHLIQQSHKRVLEFTAVVCLLAIPFFILAYVVSHKYSEKR